MFCVKTQIYFCQCDLLTKDSTGTNTIDCSVFSHFLILRLPNFLYYQDKSQHILQYTQFFVAVCYVGKYAFVCDVEEEEGILRSKGNYIFIFRLFQN